MNVPTGPPLAPPGMDPTRPVYTRLSLKHLELDTLATFRLPWESDRNDPRYVIVKQWVPEDLQDMLWEHTRRLRQRASGHVDPEPEPALFVNLDDQFHLGRHVSFCVLAPIITVECRHNELLIAARFNIETTILQYSSKQRDGHELFFHDICLKYFQNSTKDVLFTAPESDPTMAFSITRNRSQMSPQASLPASQIPSAEVSLALTRSTQLNVQYAVSSWSVSGHRVVDGQYQTFAESSLDLIINIHSAGHQWYWAGTQGETKLLTPDLTQTVKRHVVVKRIVPYGPFPFDNEEERMSKEKTRAPAADQAHEDIEADKAGLPTSEKDEYVNSLREALRRQFTFQFRMQARVKRRMGRLHRMLVLSSNDVKAKFLEPTNDVDFSLTPSEEWLNDLIAEGYPTFAKRGKGSGNSSGGGGDVETIEEEDDDDSRFPVAFMVLETVEEEDKVEAEINAANHNGNQSVTGKEAMPVRIDTHVKNDREGVGEDIESIIAGDTKGHSSSGSSSGRDKIRLEGDGLGDSPVKDDSLVEESNKESETVVDATEKADEGVSKKGEVDSIAASNWGKAEATVLEPLREDVKDTDDDTSSKGFKFPLGLTIDIEFTLDKIIERSEWDLETLHGKRLADVWEHQAVRSLYDSIKWRKDMEITRMKTRSRELRAESSTSTSRPTYRSSTHGAERDLTRDTHRRKEKSPALRFQTHRQR